MGHGVCVAAIMAREHVHGAVIGERNVAVLALGHPSAHLTLHHRSETAAVLEQNDLLVLLQGGTHGVQKFGREGSAHHLAAVKVLNVNHMYVGQSHVLVSCCQADVAILARERIVVALH